MTTDHPPFKVLFLCTGNSARSVFAEYFLKRLGGKRFEAYSAGASPSGTVNPTTLKVLRERFNIEASDARSKSWDEFRDVKFDFVITVCDNAAGEPCPVWPGQPMTAHWGLPDPAAVPDDAARRRAFAEVAQVLTARIRLLASLPVDKLERLSLQRRLRAIGTPAADAA